MMSRTSLALLSVEEMYAADARTIESGTPGLVLMEHAGAAIFEAICARWSPCPVSVLCGPGNNGGDGFVVAHLLQEAGWPVRLALMGKIESLKGDAATVAARWDGAVEPLALDMLDGADLVIDALFGAGLGRPLGGTAATIIDACNDRDLDVVAVDVPSGVHGDTGAVLGTAPRCRLTVTFCRRKRGHLLVPGRVLAGELVVADIGIPDAVVESLGVQVHANDPAIWLDVLPRHALDAHKYTRGHALVVGGDGVHSGAARMAGRAALRAGAGLVTVLAPEKDLPVYAAQLTAVMLAPREELSAQLADKRKNALLIGPGSGVKNETRAETLAALKAAKACVIDADAISVFQDSPQTLFDHVHGSTILTPHEGEFSRIFNSQGDKLSRTHEAAKRAGGVVILKGADTVIAAPDGRAVINHNAPPTLATAGAGDVLAGFALGLLAQGMPAFEAAGAAVWLHGAAAAAFGPGLIAEDLSETLPGVLADLESAATEH